MILSTDHADQKTWAALVARGRQDFAKSPSKRIYGIMNQWPSPRSRILSDLISGYHTIDARLEALRVQVRKSESVTVLADS